LKYLEEGNKASEVTVPPDAQRVVAVAVAAATEVTAAVVGGEVGSAATPRAEEGAVADTLGVGLLPIQPT